MVSADRRRYKNMGLNLDLSYITGNLLAMSFPATGVETVWRNRLNDVCDMLHSHHGSDFMIWNLTDRHYDYEKFNNQILNFPFPDHHAPPLDYLFQIVDSIDSWLKASEERGNVALVHCKGGKGRTGTVISCYLFYAGLFDTIEQAGEYFAKRRSRLEKGVTQPSQRRYMHYFSDILQGRLVLQPSSVELQSIHLHGLGAKSVTLLLEVLHYRPTANQCNLLFSKAIVCEDTPSVKIYVHDHVTLSGDILVRLSDTDTSSLNANKNKREIFHLIFHTSCLVQQQQQQQQHLHTFGRSELDCLGKRFDEDFQVSVELAPSTAINPSSTEVATEVCTIMKTKYYQTINKGEVKRRSAILNDLGHLEELSRKSRILTDELAAVFVPPADSETLTDQRENLEGEEEEEEEEEHDFHTPNSSPPPIPVSSPSSPRPSPPPLPTSPPPTSRSRLPKLDTQVPPMRLPPARPSRPLSPTSSSSFLPSPSNSAPSSRIVLSPLTSPLVRPNRPAPKPPGSITLRRANWRERVKDFNTSEDITKFYKSRDRSHTVAAPPSSSSLSSSSPAIPTSPQATPPVGRELRTWRQRANTNSSLQPVQPFSASSAASSSSSPHTRTIHNNKSDSSKEEVVKQGYLYYLSARGALLKKKWKIRWLELRADSQLMIYNSKGGKLVKHVQLDTACQFEEYQPEKVEFCFSITTGATSSGRAGKTVVFKADTEPEMHTWLNHLLKQKLTLEDKKAQQSSSPAPSSSPLVSSSLSSSSLSSSSLSSSSSSTERLRSDSQAYDSDEDEDDEMDEESRRKLLEELEVMKGQLEQELQTCKLHKQQAIEKEDYTNAATYQVRIVQVEELLAEYMEMMRQDEEGEEGASGHSNANDNNNNSSNNNNVPTTWSATQPTKSLSSPALTTGKPPRPRSKPPQYFATNRTRAAPPPPPPRSSVTPVSPEDPSSLVASSPSATATAVTGSPPSSRPPSAHFKHRPGRASHLLIKSANAVMNMSEDSDGEEMLKGKPIRAPPPVPPPPTHNSTEQQQ